MILHGQEFFTGLNKALCHFYRRGLCINANERLSAGRSKEKPASVFKFIAGTVLFVDLTDTMTVYYFFTSLCDCHAGLLNFFRIEVEIIADKMMGSDFFVEV